MRSKNYQKAEQYEIYEEIEARLFGGANENLPKDQIDFIN
jgi:hypothetical protein